MLIIKFVMKNLISRKNLGIALLIGLSLEFILPSAGIIGFGRIATLIYLVVAIILLMFK